MSELETVSRILLQASSYVEVFGMPSEHCDIDTHIKRTYRQLVRVAHPDRYADAEQALLARRCFQALGQMKVAADKACANGTYGRADTAVVTTRRGAHHIERKGADGAICATHWTKTLIDDIMCPGYLKVARNAIDNDLVQSEAVALRRLRSLDTNPAGWPFVPELLDSFRYRSENGPRLQATVTVRLEGFYTLTDLKSRYESGFDPLHMVWVWRRLLVAIDHAHRSGVIHGAVLPEHILVHPVQHGVVLVDWCYASVRSDAGDYTPIVAIVGDYRTWYPQEVMRKQAPSPATDIVMAARCMIWLLGGDPETGALPSRVPRPLRAFFRGCLASSPAARPQNARLLLEEFDRLLESMGAPYYPRRYRILVVPDRA